MSDLMRIWIDCLSILEEEALVSPAGFSAWIKELTPVKIEDDTFYLSVNNEVNKNLIIMRYHKIIKDVIAEVTGKNYEVEIFIGEKEEEKEIKKPVSIYEKYTFDNFVVGNSNRFAQSASMAVAQAPAYAYNPLFLHGGVGLGKTHLMHAVGNYIKANNPYANIVFITAENFTNELVNSIKDNKKQEFKDKYRNIDVLLVDDIQFIAGKTATEEEFFHTFNALRESNRQIILTSDRPPGEMKTLTSRLRDRFGWGLVCDIQPPDYETRKAILMKKLQDEKITISDEIIEFIAQKVKSNIRELEGVLNRIVAYRLLINREITLDFVMDAIKDYGENAETEITPDIIIEACAQFYGVKKEDIYTDKRTKDIALARQVSIYIIKELTDLSFPKIGALIGKDHTTAIYAIKKVNELMEKDEKVKFNVEGIINDIKNKFN